MKRLWAGVSTERPAMFTLTLRAKFNVGGYELPEVDLTVPLGIGAIVLVFWGLLVNTSVGG